MRVRGWLAVLLAFGLNAAAVAHEGEEHGDHDARHGGFVMMYGDLHFELVAKAAGAVELYYSDAVRAPLPAATASDVVVEIERTDGSIENVAMAISNDGEYWTGSSKPIEAPEDIIRVGFVFEGEPLVLDVPFSAMPAASADSHDVHMVHHGH